MDEYDGKKMEAQILPGGIKIAGIDQVCLGSPVWLNVTNLVMVE